MYRILKPFALFCVLFVTCAASAATETPGPQVSVATGVLQGATADGVEMFKGIPFAAPPVGELRWKAPQPAASWQGVRDATHFGDECMQGRSPFDGASSSTPMSEDCLFINVWRPANAVGKLPVMVWIYGGGFVSGGSSVPAHDGTQFAKHGVVLVNFNYRLGRFGFFGFPALTAENPEGPNGNYAFMDQIAALKWIKANIAAFGGDPDNITIFGESAGGWSVHTLLASPMAAGLFNKAIIESGGGRGFLMGKRQVSGDLPQAPSLETIGVNFAKANGIEGANADALAKLRALPADQVVGGLNMMTMGQQAATYGGPAIDGRIVLEAPDEAYASEHFNKAPLIIGANDADLGFSRARSIDEALAPFGTDKAKARAAYDPDSKGTVKDVVWSVGMDRTMIEPARHSARLFARQGLPAYEFRFSYVAPAAAAAFKNSPMAQFMMPGAQHASEVPYVFDTVSIVQKGAVVADEEMAKAMNAYWVNFAKTGNPNGAGLPEWPTYSVQSDTLMNFTQEGPKAMPDPWRERLDLTAARRD